jgi:glucose/arabinose dehydrogenase
MKKSLINFYLFCLAALTGMTNVANSQTPSITLKEISRGFTSPVGMASPNDNTNRLFIIEQGGNIKIIKEGELIKKPFLNISSRLDGLNIAYSEKGLLGMAFHPNYKTNGRFFVYYSSKYKHPKFDHKSIIAEYKVSATNPDVALTEEKIILEIYEPESNHNGGMLAFGPDGYLYIGVGDGGGAGDDHGTNGNGQNLNTLLGKILRIDVNGRKPYAIPYDNPFVGIENTRAEIWAYGLRNPWRFSFDSKTGELFCGDVGQNKYEEINIIKKGGNYGWRIMEGYHCYDPPENCNRTGLTLPVIEYDHDQGISVCGGYVYRGKLMPDHNGKYFFGDWSGKMFVIEKQTTEKWQMLLPDVDHTGKNDINGKINSMGIDSDGEIYIITQKLYGPKSPTGVVYRVE